MQALIQFDHFILFLVNKSWTSPVLDWFFPILTDFTKTDFFRWVGLPLIFILILWRLRIPGLIFFAFTVLVLGLVDGFQGKILKPFFARPRPPVEGLDVVLRAPHFGGYSFPSNHATNMFCFAVFVGFYFPRLRFPLLFLAVLVAYSRVYCGVHFPSDVVGGALLGSLFGYAFALLFRPIWKSVLAKWPVKGFSWQKS